VEPQDERPKPIEIPLTASDLSATIGLMFTTRQAARKLGLDPKTLSRYIAAKKVPSPKVIQLGNFRIHSWTESDIERVREILPRIANGRKTRYQKAKQRKQSKKK